MAQFEFLLNHCASSTVWLQTRCFNLCICLIVAVFHSGNPQSRVINGTTVMPECFLAETWKHLAATVRPANFGLLRFTQLCVGSSRAQSTYQRYSGPWQRFKQWCKHFGYAYLPAKPVTVAMFLAHLLKICAGKNQGYGVIRMASAAIFQAHKLANWRNITNHPVVAAVRDCAKRVLVNGLLNRKEPLDKDTCVATVVQILNAKTIPNYRLQLATFIMVCFAGFLRYNDATHVFCDEIRFYRTHMEIFLETRKNRQFREGNVVFIARGKSAVCPVVLTERLLAVMGTAGLHVPLFRGYDGKAALRHPDRSVAMFRSPWSYDQARSTVFLAISSAFNVPVASLRSVYGLHSLRSGGATCVAKVGIPAMIFQRHGGWADPRSVGAYIKGSLDHRLQPTACMDL